MLRILLLILLLIPSIGYADLYQWTDTNGVKHYSNTPPESDTGGTRQMEEYVAEENTVTNYLQEAIDLFKSTGSQDITEPEKPIQRKPKVVMYTTPSCGYCHRAKAYFNQHGIRFTELDVTKSKKAKKQFKALNGRGVPLIVIGGQRIAGFNKSAINHALGLP